MNTTHPSHHPEPHPLTAINHDLIPAHVPLELRVVYCHLLSFLFPTFLTPHNFLFTLLSRSLTLSQAPTLSHALSSSHALSHSLALSRALSRSLALSHALSRSLTLSRALSRSLSHSHALCHALSSHTRSLSRALSLTLRTLSQYHHLPMF
jgi:hypothetical protein